MLRAERRVAWLGERDNLYGGVPVAEITAFVEILASYQVNLYVRIWREFNHSLVLSTSIGAGEYTSRPLTAGCHHSGEMDTNTAHMRLISNMNSFVYTPQPRALRRAVEQDPDYEPKKKKRK
jgi:hypothetical protein